jgi:hypothetical protein
LAHIFAWETQPMSRRDVSRRKVSLESLEDRLCLASSVGWDGPGPGSAELTYFIANAPSSLSMPAVRTAIQTALHAWSAVASITFTPTSVPNQPDSIDISFGRIDGRNRTLAYAYFPDDVNPSRLAGDIKFDSAERWEVGNGQGGGAVDLVLTAVHEIGHALGLEHSRAAGSVMRPAISPSQRFNGLGAADKAAILSLYAPAESTPASDEKSGPTPTASTSNPVPRFRIPRHGRPRGYGRPG